MGRLIAVVATIMLSGCTVTAVDMDGSKETGTVVVGANVGEFATVDWTEADAKARAKCRRWGYDDAEGFEGIRKRCIAHSGWFSSSYSSGYGGSGCSEWEVTRKYQCIE